MARQPRHVYERIEYLYALAQRWLDENRFEDSRTAIKHLRALATKHTITTPEINKRVCKDCYTLLVAGKTCTLRIKNGRRVLTCTHCQAVKRLGLT